MFDQVLTMEPFSIQKEDVLLLEGSAADINPSLYGDEAGPYLNSPDTLRDSRECALLRRFSTAGAKILGICKGAQLACVFAGGNLIQHVTGHSAWNGHQITAVHECDEPFINMTCSSVHHQMMNPFDLPKDHYKILAHTPKLLSQTYLDGKGFDLLNGNTPSFLNQFVEPEVVWFPKLQALAIQGHPEYMRQDAPFVQWSRRLVHQYLLSPND